MAINVKLMICLLIWYAENLLTQPVDKDEKTMPSPEKLKRKILIKVCISRCGQN